MKEDVEKNTGGIRALWRWLTYAEGTIKIMRRRRVSPTNALDRALARGDYYASGVDLKDVEGVRGSLMLIRQKPSSPDSGPLPPIA